MSLSDCSKCWDTPCTCGYDYRNYPQEAFINFIVGILGYKSNEESIVIIENVLQKLQDNGQ